MKCITFDRKAQDALPDHIKARMKVDREKARKQLVENKSGHHCPYCDHIEMEINSHFAHIEMEHPGKSLIVI